MRSAIARRARVAAMVSCTVFAVASSASARTPTSGADADRDASSEVEGSSARPATSAPDPRFGGAARRDDRFVNLYPFRLPTVSDLADWYWHWWLAGDTQAPPGGYAAIPVDRTDVAMLRANRTDTTVTWVGHATVLLQVGGFSVLTDPQFSERASPFSFIGPRRKVGVPFALADAPHVDIVLISHNHYDHLDADSVDALARQPGGPPLFVVPLGVERWFHARGIDNVVAMDWWNTRDIPPSSSASTDRLRITFVPAQHWSSRSPADRFETLWGGYVVERVRLGSADPVDFRFFFAGDTGYAPLFRDLIHARFDHFDFAAIPIGAYEPNRYLHAQHIDPAEAVRIHRDLAVRQSLGVHWGTFALTTERFDQPPRDLADALRGAGLTTDAFVVFRHGETRVLETRRASQDVAAAQPASRWRSEARPGRRPERAGRRHPVGATAR